jgi:hypothetical protein
MPLTVAGVAVVAVGGTVKQLSLMHGSAPPASWSCPDAVYTPPELAAFLVGLLPWEGIRTVCEPSAGNAAWIVAVVEHVLGAPISITGIDVDPSCGAADVFGMQRRIARIARKHPDWPLDKIRYYFVRGSFLDVQIGRCHRSLGNPPYSNIEEHVDRALELSDEVAFLLPLGIVEGSSGAWLASTPLRKVWVLRERPFPKHVRGCGFFWWQHGYEGPTEIVPGVSWKGAA